MSGFLLLIHELLILIYVKSELNELLFIHLFLLLPFRAMVHIGLAGEAAGGWPGFRSCLSCMPAHARGSLVKCGQTDLPHCAVRPVSKALTQYLA